MQQIAKSLEEDDLDQALRINSRKNSSSRSSSISYSRQDSLNLGKQNNIPDKDLLKPPNANVIRKVTESDQSHGEEKDDDVNDLQGGWSHAAKKLRQVRRATTEESNHVLSRFKARSEHNLQHYMNKPGQDGQQQKDVDPKTTPNDAMRASLKAKAQELAVNRRASQTTVALQSKMHQEGSKLMQLSLFK